MRPIVGGIPGQPVPLEFIVMVHAVMALTPVPDWANPPDGVTVHEAITLDEFEAVLEGITD